MFPPTPPPGRAGSDRYDVSGGVATLARPQPPAPPVHEVRLAEPPPPPETSGQEAQGESGKRRWLIALVAIAALVGLGFIAGNRLSEDSAAQVESTSPVTDTAEDSANTPATTDRSAADPADEGAGDEVATDESPAQALEPLTPAQPLPVPQTAPIELDAVEPVAEVAKAVGPAVVLITVSNFGQGSGIIYDESGLVVTNAHVVGDAATVNVQLASGFKVTGEVLGRDPGRDVAVVKIDTDAEFGVAVLAPQSTVDVGQLAVAIGSPFGLDQTVTAGVVSAVGRFQEGLNSVEMVQTDAPINPGNSGGALADRQGRVIGMNTAIRTGGASNSNAGVGFAIPADIFKLVADRLVAGESLESGFLGVGIQDVETGEPGASVTSVEPSSAAAAAQLEPGDRIVEFNGQAILNGGDLSAAVKLLRPGTQVQFSYIDAESGQRVDAEATLGSR